MLKSQQMQRLALGKQFNELLDSPLTFGTQNYKRHPDRGRQRLSSGDNYIYTFFLFLISISSRGSGRRQENRGGFRVNFLSARNGRWVGREEKSHKTSFPRLLEGCQYILVKKKNASEIFLSSSVFLQILSSRAPLYFLSLGLRVWVSLDILP